MSKRGESNKSTASTDDIRNYVSIRIQMLAAVFNRKTTDQMVGVYKDALERYPMTVLGKAFSKAERQLERFPTPRILIIYAEDAMPSQGWRYNFRKVDSSDPETGMAVQVLIDPVNGEELFRSADCPEGRAFLAKLRELRNS